MSKRDKKDWLKPYTPEKEIIKGIEEEIKKFNLRDTVPLRGRVMALPVTVWPVTVNGTPIEYLEIKKKDKDGNEVGTGNFYIVSKGSKTIICGENTMQRDHMPSPKDLQEKFTFLDFPENPYKFYVIASDNENVKSGDIFYVRPDTIMDKMKPVNINGAPVFFLDYEWAHSKRELK